MKNKIYIFTFFFLFFSKVLAENLEITAKNITLDKDSTISIDDLDNISLGSAASNKRKSKRKSDKNTVSLAI